MQSAAAPAPCFPSHLKVVRQLGRGAYGTVHLCDDTQNGGQVAVKHIKNAARHGKSILREVRLLARLKHENLLHLIDFPAVPSPNFEDVFLVLPYMPADLHKVIQSKQSLSDKHVQVMTCQILRALGHLHSAGVAHRDLKPANILLTADCKLKVCDFGLARGDMPDPDDDDQAYGVLTEYVVTRWYRAPEVMLLPKQYSTALDIWSVGCILCEILGRQALFPGKDHIDMVCRVAQVLGTPSDAELEWLPKKTDAYRFLRKVCPQTKGQPLQTRYPRAPPACLDLAYGLLRWDPNQRLTAAEAQEHEYLKKYLPKEAPPPLETFDWTFDGFKPTSTVVKEKLYAECARFHPEILDRDQAMRSPRVSLVGAAAPPPAVSGRAVISGSQSLTPSPPGGYPSSRQGHSSRSGTPSQPRQQGAQPMQQPQQAHQVQQQMSLQPPQQQLHQSRGASPAHGSGIRATSSRGPSPSASTSMRYAYSSPPMPSQSVRHASGASALVREAYGREGSLSSREIGSVMRPPVPPSRVIPRPVHAR